MNIEKLDAIFTNDTVDAEYEITSTQEVTELAKTKDDKLSANELFVDEELKNTIRELTTGADEIRKIAEISEHPRAFEVYSTLMKTKIDALKELADIEKNKRKTANQVAGTINNTQVNVTQGTNINEILKSLENQKA